MIHGLLLLLIDLISYKQSNHWHSFREGYILSDMHEIFLSTLYARRLLQQFGADWMAGKYGEGRQNIATMLLTRGSLAAQI